MEYVSEIAAAVFGAVSGAFGNWIIQRKNDRSDERFASKMIQDENYELRQRVNLLEGYNARHVKENAELKIRLGEVELYNEILKSIPHNWPFPVWMVNMRHEYDFISKMYWEVFLKPLGKSLNDCIGKNLYEIWPHPIAQTFVSHNKQVMESGEIFNGTEKVIDSLGKEHEWQIIKYKRDMPYGLVGVAIPKNGYFNKYLKNIRKQ